MNAAAVRLNPALRRLGGVILAAMVAVAALARAAPTPRVLILGDSISIGYTPVVRAALAGRADVQRPAENCRSSRQLRERLDAYLQDGRWDMIHFNCGLHDLTFVGADRRGLVPADGGRIQVPLEEYAANLRGIVARLRATGAVLVWATTTPVGPGQRFRRPEDVARYNAVAADVMREAGVAVHDLHALVRDGLATGALHWTDDVHYDASSYAAIGRRVADALAAHLPTPP